MYQIKDPITGFWRKVPEPRWASVWQTVMYLGVSFAGLAGAVYPPASLVEQMSPWMLTYWGMLLCFGGILGAWSVLPGLYWLERIGIVACGFGFTMYGVGLWSAYVIGAFSHPSVALPWIGFLAALTANLGVRLARVKHGLRDPEKYSTYGSADN